MKTLGAFLAVAVAAAQLPGVAYAQVCGRGAGDVTVSGTQVLNTFHPSPPGVATLVLAGATSIPVAAARSGGGAAIATGDLVAVIQMQGAELDQREENLTNGIYGDGAGGADRRGVIAGATFRAGTYELARAAGPVTAGALPLMSGLTNGYFATDAVTAAGNVGSGFHRYQVVRVLEARDLTIPAGATLTSLAWDGRSGGVVAVDVSRNLIVNGAIDVVGMGFRGGSPVIPAGTPGSETNNPQLCRKGEGLAGTPTRVYSRLGGVVVGTDGLFGSESERGGPGNAGGCPVASDSGGGGGGGGRPGGVGSVGPNPNLDPNVPRPGEGYANLTRLLMGGGGGSGSLDDPAVVGAVSGQAGGGLVLIRAANLSGLGTVRADGDSGGTQPQEGGGGGGGGGSIFVFTNSTSFAGVTLRSRGGNGGTTQTTDDGGGGGGGGGFVLVATPTGMATVTVDVQGGAGGTSPTQNGGAGTGGFQQVSTPPIGTPPCPVECTTPAHCADGNVCTTDTCTAGVCSNPAVTAGQPGGCTAPQVCSGAPSNTCVQCVTNAQCSGATPVCDSANVCRAPPVVSTPANGSTTNNPTPPITGTAEAGSTVTVFIDGANAGTTTATAGGTFSFTPAASLGNGPHTVSVTAGTPALPSNTNTFTVDTVAPAAPVVQAPANGSTVTTARPPITGTAEAGSTVTVRVDGVVIGSTTATAGGTFSFTPTADLSQGSHTVNVTATDAGGNVSPVSNTNTFTVDSVAPAAPVVQAPANGSTVTTARPPITGTAEAGSTVTVRVDGMVIGTTTATAGGTFSFTPTADLSQGSHTVNVTATDAGGNVSPVSNTNTFTVDSVAPAAPV
ncbi:MAG: adhesin, partial [Myxococcaceae bacterium]|nr:adhesin [Myxococcaceae bacterium]